MERKDRRSGSWNTKVFSKVIPWAKRNTGQISFSSSGTVGLESCFPEVFKDVSQPVCKSETALAVQSPEWNTQLWICGETEASDSRQTCIAHKSAAARLTLWLHPIALKVQRKTTGSTSLLIQNKFRCLCICESSICSHQSNKIFMVKELVKNVLGTELQSCCTDPVTGFYRDGYCNTGPMDQGSHISFQAWKPAIAGAFVPCAGKRRMKQVLLHQLNRKPHTKERSNSSIKKFWRNIT